MRSKEVTIPIYGGKLTIIQTNKLKKVEKRYGLMSLKGIDACAFIKYRENGSAKYYLAFQGETTPSIIAHESLHMVGLVFQNINAMLTIENDEPQCYLLEWIVRECHKFLKVKQY